MNKDELLEKVAHIEQNAQRALLDYPALVEERLRMIAAFARYIRSALQNPSSADPA